MAPALLLGGDDTKLLKKKKKAKVTTKGESKKRKIRDKNIEAAAIEHGSSNDSDAPVEKKKLKKERQSKDKKEARKERNKIEDGNDTLKGSTSISKNEEAPLATESSPVVVAASSENTGTQHDMKLPKTQAQQPRPIVESSALPVGVEPDPQYHSVSLLLFYQYIEPPWSDATYKRVKEDVYKIGHTAGVSGRMRVAKEGLNCTLTGSAESVTTFCHLLRDYMPQHFDGTEFKVTHHLARDKHAFGGLKVMPVTELVHYGLDGDKAPPIAQYSGVHLEPAQYHEKLADPNTVIIDVRNHYEAAIGRFVPPKVQVSGGSDSATDNANATTSSSSSGRNDATSASPNDASASNDTNGPLFLDPKMRKSTEFPVWLDSAETKAQLKGKQVLMYCTGGIRCERASALLKCKMETDPSVQELNIQGVYQLQGGIDKYFKEFPDGGYWQGKNYTFDKRFCHAPLQHEAAATATAANTTDPSHATPHENSKASTTVPLGKCEACAKPWDNYRGKRRCPTCGVPSLVCKECHQADQDGTKRLGKWVRCDLCVEQNVTSKKELKDKEQKELAAYESRLHEKGLLKPKFKSTSASASALTSANADISDDTNPNGITRLYLKNMCRKSMTEEVLLERFPDITHIVWRTDRTTGQFFGQGWVQVAHAAAAAHMVAQSGRVVLLGRPLYIEYQPADGKDVWPPPKSAVHMAAT